MLTLLRLYCYFWPYAGAKGVSETGSRHAFLIYIHMLIRHILLAGVMQICIYRDVDVLFITLISPQDFQMFTLLQRTSHSLVERQWSREPRTAAMAFSPCTRSKLSTPVTSTLRVLRPGPKHRSLTPALMKVLCQMITRRILHIHLDVFRGLLTLGHPRSKRLWNTKVRL